MKKQTLLLSFFLIGLLRLGFAQGQQVIGMFPRMNGGFENYTTNGSVLNVYLSGIPGGVEKDSFTAEKATVIGTMNTAGGRSGNNFLRWQNTSSGTSNEMWTPTQSNATILSNTDYIVQFFWKKINTGSARSFTMGISPNGSQNFGSYVNSSTLGSNGAASVSWTISTTKVTSGSNANATRYGLVGLSPNGGGFASPEGYDLDDLVIYPGTIADVIAPNKPQTTVATSLTPPSIDVSWGAPAGGVDGGGYVVIRTTTNPATTPINPNQNGIYAVGNTIGTGTVAYIGTATSFTDASLAYNFTYYYLVFAVDKAFNYSVPDTAQYLLPVTFTNFTAQKQGNKHLLSWHTATENNNHGFYIERSADGSSFTTMQFEPSKATDGNSSSGIQYNWSDELPLKGCNYYRLKQTDKDGRQVYSQTVMLKTGSQKTIELLNVFPSPASSWLQVKYQSDEAIPVYFTITDITGRVVIQQQATAAAGENTTPLNVAMLRKGNYILKLSEAGSTLVATKKFIIK